MAEQQVSKPAKQPKAAKASSGGGKKGLIIALAQVVVVVLGVCSYGFVLKNQDAIYPNVYVAGVNVGGLKRDAAVSAVSEAVQKSYASDTLNVVLPDRTLSLTPDVTQVALNPDQAIDEAMRYGRSGGPISAVINYLRAGQDDIVVMRAQRLRHFKPRHRLLLPLFPSARPLISIRGQTCARHI